jgi:hypothetical protein
MTVIILDYCPWKVTRTVILADAHLQHLSILRRYSEFSKDEVDDLFVENQDGYTAFYLNESLKDCTISYDGTTFKAHKGFLASVSIYFQR